MGVTPFFSPNIFYQKYWAEKDFKHTLSFEIMTFLVRMPYAVTNVTVFCFLKGFTIRALLTYLGYCKCKWQNVSTTESFILLKTILCRSRSWWRLQEKDKKKQNNIQQQSAGRFRKGLDNAYRFFHNNTHLPWAMIKIEKKKQKQKVNIFWTL